MRFLESNIILNSTHIGSRPRNSIWKANVYTSRRAKINRRLKHVGAPVSLDITRAYDSLEYNTSMSHLECSEIPVYIQSWIGAFLTGRTFFCSKHGLSSSQYQQFREVPQGSVLSAVLFNILLRSIPIMDGIQTSVYADNIAFYS